jgi:predicted nucleic acid-binding protein
MPGLVLDASVVMAWTIPDEAQFGRATAVMQQVTGDGAVVPGLWRLEVGNALLMAERRGRLPAVQLADALRLLEALPIETDPETGLRAWTASASLARRHRLSLYDACYLELAARRGLALAGFDAALVAAAGAVGVAVA